MAADPTPSCAGEVLPDEGEASVSGFPITRNLSEARRNLGYCPQSGGLPGPLTGRELLRMYGRIWGVPRKKLEQRVESLLRRLALSQYADRYEDQICVSAI